MRSPWFAVAILLLAGCSDAPEDTAAPPSRPTEALSSSPSPVATPPPAGPTVEVIAVSFDGNLGTQVHGCVFLVGVCQTQAFVPDTSDLLVERPGTVVKAVDLSATWTAQTPATTTLHFGFMVMPKTHCDGCTPTMLGELEGPSPVHMQAAEVAVPLTANDVVHVYAYNPAGFVYDPNVPGYAFVSSEQAFHVEGTITVEVPAAVTPAASTSSTGPGQAA